MADQIRILIVDDIPETRDHLTKLLGFEADVEVGDSESARLVSLMPADDTTLEAVDARLVLEPLWYNLPARDRRVLHLRYFEERSQREIGEDLGVSQVQVSRLLTRIHRDLRRRLTGLPEAS